MAEVPPIEDALQKLADASTPQELACRHQETLRVVRLVRKAKAKEHGPLAQSVALAMTFWNAQKAEGVSLEERVTGLAKTLKAAWPQRRTEPWHYLCDACNDTGLVMRVCKPGDRCDGISTRTNHYSEYPDGQHTRLCRYPDANRLNYTHDYGTPCHCEKGRRFILQRPSSAGTEDFTKSTKRKSWSRFGR